jgi:hypothetical protein
MSTLVPITFETLESALQWSSSGAPSENEALLSRTTGELFFRSMQGDFGEELPDDIEDGTVYIAVPHKNDLDLGRSLVLAFAEEQAPAHLSAIESFFRQRGAYAKFKALLERTQLLGRWYEYEAAATKKALEAWASENGFTVVGSNSDA